MDVWIPTLGRPDNIRAIIPRWLQVIKDEQTIRLVVARDEASATMAIVRDGGWRDRVSVSILPRSVQGIGAIRGWIVKAAFSWGHKTLIMSDDDIYPHHSAEIAHMMWLTRQPRILGVGCVTSYHSLLLGHRKEMLNESVPILATSGYGFRLFCLNIERAIEVGNFNPFLDVSYEDAELMRQGVLRGMRWYLDPLVKAIPLGKRFEAGGIAAYTGDPEERARRTALNYELCYIMHSKYMAKPPKVRMGWKKMLDDYWPGWREATE